MPSKKARAHQQAQPAPQPSDYETDAPPQIDIPPPLPRSNEELNLSVLRRHNPEVTSIRHVTSYAVLYTFSLNSEQWEKVGVEGTMFVCALTPSPIGAERFCTVILNRRGLDNFSMDLVSDEELEITDEYIILQGEQQVFGLWIFAEPPPSSTANARLETAEKMMQLAKIAAQSRAYHEQLAANGTDSTAGQGLESYPMGRSGSLREILGQQRDQDAGFSVHNHDSAAMHAGAPAATQSDVLSQLFMKAKQNYNGVG